MIQENKKIDALQAVRAFAAIFVMIFHGTSIAESNLGYTYLDRYFSIGYMGVDIFFVLSGFIIFYTSNPSSFKILSFLKKRFIRIYPIYWVVTAILITQYFLFPTPDKAYKGDPEVILASLFLFPHDQQVLGIAWTLTYEVIFYLVFAFTFSVSRKCLLIVFMLWSLIIFITYFLHLKTNVFTIDTLIQPIILEFGLGCLLAYLYQKNKTFRFWKLSVAVGSVLLAVNCTIVYLVTKTEPDAFGGVINRVYLFGIPSSLIIFGLLYYDRPVSKLLVGLGDSSYSLYLIHGTVLALLIQVAVKFHLTKAISNFPGVTFVFIITIFIGRMFYLFVEKPLLSFFRHMKNRNVARNLKSA